MLSQTEIETLGLSESGRLSLVDGFVADRLGLKSEEARIINQIKSLYKEIGTLEAEVSSLSDDLKRITPLRQNVIEIEAQLRQLQGSSEVAAERNKMLNNFGLMSASITAKESVLARFEAQTGRWVERLSEVLIDDLGLETWSEGEENDPLSNFRLGYPSALQKVADAATHFAKMKTESALARAELGRIRVEIEKQARTVRSEAEKIAEGTGALSRNLSLSRAQIAQLETRESLLQERVAKLYILRKRRDDFFSELVKIRELRYKKRVDAANLISNSLKPHIFIEVEQSAQYGEYSKAIANALRGSGMKYNDLATKISELISPRELIDFVECGDFRQLAELIQIPEDRAARLLSHLADFGIAEVVTCSIDDNIKLGLLDGVGHKDIASLSAGQRCTVILSIVLQHSERTLIIDQPEDHLDNAFITNTVIKSLKNRSGVGQVILSTHNANIPVLGGAQQIIELTSDGRNGFIQVCQPLEHPSAVDAITSVMEGGIDAFKKRSSFYDEHTL